YKAGALKATMGDMDKGKSCGACHNGKDAFKSSDDCVKCHKM
ncbi:MAG TPA: c(7)-type cytochrome triheme domain-containing protein, partial [Geobacteraceae bacterium]|nr:c(7)-type cytochrome triheme domain-containing protein [Geobacteraceae bacterium]